jgi:hypothetical protein
MLTWVEIELQALITEREGMVAENAQRQRLGESMAYQEDSFLVLAEQIRNLAKQDTQSTRNIAVYTGDEE